MLTKLYFVLANLLVSSIYKIASKITEGSIKISREWCDKRAFNEKCSGDLEAIFYSSSSLY